MSENVTGHVLHFIARWHHLVLLSLINDDFDDDEDDDDDDSDMVDVHCDCVSAVVPPAAAVPEVLEERDEGSADLRATQAVDVEV